MRVVGYVRVSTDEQVNEGISMAAQAEKIRLQAQLDELELVEVIDEAGYSAKSLNRPGLQRALEMLRTGQVDGLLVAKLDRLTRNVADMAALIADYFGDKARHAATLLSVADKVDTRSPSGRLVLHILASVSQWEREEIGTRTKTALAYKRSQGVKLGAPALGQTPEEIAILQHAVDLRRQGLTLQAIADQLNAEGLKTKRGGTWYPSTVSNIIGRSEAA